MAEQYRFDFDYEHDDDGGKGQRRGRQLRAAWGKCMEDFVWTVAVIAMVALVFLFGEAFARKLVGPTEAAKSSMTESSSLEQRLGDLDRQHNKTREFLINYTSLTTALLVGLFSQLLFQAGRRHCLHNRPWCCLHRHESSRSMAAEGLVPNGVSRQLRRPPMF
jgi:hypothetical protein